MKDVYMGKNWDMEKRNNKYSYTFEIFFIIISQFSHSVMFNSLWPHGLQHARLPCPSLFSGGCSNSCPLSWWCHPTISSSVALFSSCPQPFTASGSFPMSWLFALGGQSIGASASASVSPVNIQGWSPLRWTDLISLLSTGLSGVFSSTTVRRHLFFSILSSLWSTQLKSLFAA